MRKFLLTLAAALVLAALPARAQYRDDQFKRDAFTQNYADTSQKTAADTSQLFSFKEFFGALSHKRTASLKTLEMGSTIFIGGNQIYHRQYWKLPIIYGGIGAGIGFGLHYGNLYNTTSDEQYRKYSTLCYVGAGLVWWGSLLDGAVNFERGKYPNPSKSTLYSLLLPGLGQFYNGEVWKIPIYYGLMAGGIYFMADNNVQYNRWKNIHNLATSEDPTVTKPPQTAETALYYRDMYRRYRDYSILFTALAYILQVVDANVFAYMQDFEVSDDISLRIEPSITPQGAYSQLPAMGMSIGLRF